MNPLQLSRLLIYIQLIVITSMISYMYQYWQHYDGVYQPELALERNKNDRPRMIWKHHDGHHVVVPIEQAEYNHVSEMLGYDTRRPSDFNMFRCVAEPKDSPCNIYRQRSLFRILNYEGAEITFTDMITGLQSVVTYKTGLVSLGGKYIPKGFHIPHQTKEFFQYAYSFDRMIKWMQKNTRHRQVKVTEFDELDLTRESLIQKFIPNPFLIDGRKFSIGVYVAFSSGNPLRAYVLNSQYSLRFCSKPYDYQNLSDVATYITDGVASGIKKIRQIKSLRKYNLDLHYSSIQSLRAHFNSIVTIPSGGDWSSVRFQIMDAVRDVLLTRNDRIIQNISASNTYRHFQWTRWDFILDSNFNIHLIEANIVPGMHCKTYTVNQVDKTFCNNVMYNLFQVMGIASSYDFRRTSIHYVIRDSDVNVENAMCYTSTCNQCDTQECQLCTKCLSDNQRCMLKSVLWEHLRRGEMKLAYPFNLNESNETGNSWSHNLDDDTLTTEWLRLKCLKDIQWCDGG